MMQSEYSRRSGNQSLNNDAINHLSSVYLLVMLLSSRQAFTYMMTPLRLNLNFKCLICSVSSEQQDNGMAIFHYTTHSVDANFKKLIKTKEDDSDVLKEGTNGKHAILFFFLNTILIFNNKLLQGQYICISRMQKLHSQPKTPAF